MARPRLLVLLVAAVAWLGAAGTALGVFGVTASWVPAGRGAGETFVAVDAAGGTVYLSEPGVGPTGRVARFDAAGAPRGTLEVATGSDVQYPGGLAVDSAGRLFVFEGSRNRVAVVRPDGTVERTIAPTGTDAFDDLAQAIALDAADNLYVADTRASRILVIAAGTATVTRRIPLGGAFVNDVAVDASGHVYALMIFGDAGCQARVQRHAPTGELVGQWVVTDTAYTCARLGLAVDRRTGEVLVSTQGGPQSGVRRYRPDGTPVGAPLTGTGTAGSTLQASGLATDSAGNLFVVDIRDHRIVRFGEAAPPAPAPPAPAAPARTPAPDLQDTIPSPRTIAVGPATVVAPGTISLRSLRRSRCVRTLVVSTKPAVVLVSIYSGRRSIRLFGQREVRFSGPGRRVACIRVPFRARTFDARTGLRIAIGVAIGSVARDGDAPPRRRTVTRPIGLVP